jgi:hypothetical protein
VKTRLISSTVCTRSIDKRHYKLMNYMPGAFTTETCERCGERIWVDGAKWASGIFVICEEEFIEDLLR